MKIICIDGNIGAHCRPVFFMKPETALLRCNMPMFYPDFTKDLRCGVSLLLRINRLGRSIALKFVHRYYAEIGIGIDFVAADLLRQSRSEGLAWEQARSFDYSLAAGSEWLPKASFEDMQSIKFSLMHNDIEVQNASAADLTWSFDEIIARVSQYVMLKTGDLIMTGVPSYIEVNIGDHLAACLAGQVLLNFMCK